VLTRLNIWKGMPRVVIDPLGNTTDEFLDKLLRRLKEGRRPEAIPAAEEPLAWQRIRYVDMSGRNGFITK
jgi:hypothetical protein